MNIIVFDIAYYWPNLFVINYSAIFFFLHFNRWQVFSTFLPLLLETRAPEGYFNVYIYKSLAIFIRYTLHVQ